MQNDGTNFHQVFSNKCSAHDPFEKQKVSRNLSQSLFAWFQASVAK